jgi:hypothetical protein
MNYTTRLELLVTLIASVEAHSVASAQTGDAQLPPGVRAVWDAGKAYRETTPTRERVCINGLWRWQPAEKGADQVPAENWGYFKVPASWPGVYPTTCRRIPRPFSPIPGGKARGSRV